MISPIDEYIYYTKIRDKFYNCVDTNSDINEHLKTLEKYATKCDHVTEMGVRGVVSTWAFLVARPKKLVSIDLMPAPINEVVEYSAKIGTVFEFKMADTADENFVIEETDLLFIDTWHIYEQLKKELELHSGKAKKYIILHDTTTYGEVGEPVTYNNTAIKANYSKNGLWKAVEEFLVENPCWKIKEKFTNNNGLTILTRVK